MPYTILYHPEVEEDIEVLDKKQRKIIADTIKTRLGNEPGEIWEAS